MSHEFTIINKGRECGTCSMCCKVYEIPSLNKSASEWCEHCQPGKGCKSYSSRPQECIDFRCLWQLNNDWPDYMKPSESKVVLSTNDDMTVNAHVDPGSGYVLAKGHRVRTFLEGLAMGQKTVYIILGSEELYISPYFKSVIFDETAKDGTVKRVTPKRLV